jgi:Domain of unknown function DUF11
MPSWCSFLIMEGSVSSNPFRRLGYRVGTGLAIALVIASIVGRPAYAAGGALLFATPHFFSTTPVGSTTTSSVVLTDESIDDLGVHIDSVQIDGTDAGDFRIVGDRCSGTTLWWPQLAYSCQIDVAFTPSQVGFRRATLAVVSDAANGPVNIELVGEGVLGADLAANLTAAAKVLPRHKLTYGITVSNAGPLDASSNLILSLPLGVDVIAVNLPGNCSVETLADGAPFVRCVSMVLAAGQSIDGTVLVRVGTLQMGTVLIASLQVNSGELDPNPINNLQHTYTTMAPSTPARSS